MNEELLARLQKAAPGTKAVVRFGSRKGTWVKLDCSWHTDVHDVGWANVATGRVLHYSFLEETDTLITPPN